MARAGTASMRRACLGLALTCTAPAFAQVVTDGTLGAATALQGPDFGIDAGLGRTVGGNLFHSFALFDIGVGESATFFGPDSILNVIARVTGGQASDIDGGLRTSGMPVASLWLINPDGVMFGPGAGIDVPGSVYVTTADYVTLGSGSGAGRFDATNPGQSLLVSAPPSAFGFLAGPIGDIVLDGTQLTRPAGTEFTLVGGDVLISEGDVLISEGVVNIPSGRVQIGAVASAGAAAIGANGVIGYSGFGAMGDVTIARSVGLVNAGVNNLDVSSARSSNGPGGGTVLIRGGRFVSQSGAILADNLASESGGEIDLAFSRSAMFAGNTRISSSSRADGAVTGIRIDAPEVLATDLTDIRSEARGRGNGGNIEISGRNLAFDGNASISTAAFLAGGNGGSIRLAASDEIVVRGTAFIQSSTRGSGDAGSIDLAARDVHILDRGSILALAFVGSSGDGGVISITASGELEFFGTGAGLPRSENALISTSANGSGNGGDIRISAGELRLGGLALIESRSRGAGDAGSVVVDAGTTSIEGGAGMNSRSEGSGDGGRLDLRFGDFTMSGGASLSAEALGTGLAGNIALQAESTSLAGARISTAAAISDGGNIAIDPGDLLLLDDTVIETSVQSGVGDGGNIRIGSAAATPEFLVARGSRIQANAFGGDGGNIDISAEYLIVDAYSVIEASSQLGVDGVITFANPEVDLTSLIPPAAADPGANDAIATTTCERAGVRGSRLVVAGSAGSAVSASCR